MQSLYTVIVQENKSYLLHTQSKLLSGEMYKIFVAYCLKYGLLLCIVCVVWSLAHCMFSSHLSTPSSTNKIFKLLCLWLGCFLPVASLTLCSSCTMTAIQWGWSRGQQIVGSTRNQCNSCVLVSSSCLSDIIQMKSDFRGLYHAEALQECSALEQTCAHQRSSLVLLLLSKQGWLFCLSPGPPSKGVRR